MNKDEVRNRRKIFAGLTSFYFLHFATLGTVFPYTGFFLKSRHFSGTEIGILLALFPVVKFLATSRWTDIYTASPNKTLFVKTAVSGSALSVLPLFYFHGFAATAVCLTLFGLFRVGIIPVIDNAGMAYGEKTGTQYGHMRLFGSIGFICSSVVSGVMIDRFGPDSFIIMFTSLGLLCSIPVGLIKLSDWSVTSKNKITLLYDKNLVLITLMLIIYLSTNAFHSNFFNLKVDEIGAGQGAAGLMWSAGVLAEIVMMFLAGSILKKVNAKRLMIFSALMAVLRYWLTAEATSETVLFLANSLHGFTYGAFHVAVLTYFRRTLSPETQLKMQSIYSGLGFGLGSVIGSFLSGVVYDVGGTSFVFISAAAAAAVSLVPLIYVKSDKH
jgi:PPP family 3-phenylpropionic acid transporter